MKDEFLTANALRAPLDRPLLAVGPRAAREILPNENRQCHSSVLPCALVDSRRSDGKGEWAMIVEGIDLTGVAGAATASVGILYCIWYLATLRRAPSRARVDRLPGVQPRPKHGQDL